MRFIFCILFFSQQNVMNDLNMTNTILDTFSVKYSFPHFTFLFNCSLQKQEQQIGGFATVHLSNLKKKVILSINTRHALFKLFFLDHVFKSRTLRLENRVLSYRD